MITCCTKPLAFDLLALVIVTVAWLTGCGETVVPALSRVDGAVEIGDVTAATDVSGDTSPSGDSAVVTDAGFCGGSGPIVRLPGETCEGDVRARFFRFAACSCTTLAVSGKLRASSFRSGGTGGGSASLAANEWIALNADTSIEGILMSGGARLVGTPALTLRNTGNFARDVTSGGSVDTEGTFTIGGDLRSAGDVAARGAGISVRGALHTSSKNTVVGVTADKGRITEDISVSPPCACDRELDVAAVVTANVGDTDNTRFGLAREALIRPATPVTLPCGRYVFDRIDGSVVLNVTGRTAIFVPGDVRVDGGFRINLDKGAELDLFVTGNVVLEGTARFGSLDAPSKVRVYVAGETLELSGNAELGANFYAPHADVAFASDFALSGAIFAKRLAFSGNFTLRYDETVVEGGSCTPPGKGCKDCNDCGGNTPACKGGTCGACTENSDCCAPLVCRTGRCVASIR